MCCATGERFGLPPLKPQAEDAQQKVGIFAHIPATPRPISTALRAFHSAKTDGHLVKCIMTRETERQRKPSPPEANPPEHPPAPARDRCRFSFADRRRCGMLRWRRHRAYCLSHAREE